MNIINFPKAFIMIIHESVISESPVVIGSNSLVTNFSNERHLNKNPKS